MVNAYSTNNPPGVHLGGLHGVSDDLGRLDAMISDAIDRLVSTFTAIQTLAAEHQTPEISRAAVEAITALQFQDMATQLIAHCRHRIDHAMTHQGDATSAPFSSTHFVPSLSSPVSQSGVGAGTIELF